FFFQAEDGIRDFHVTGVHTCALPIFRCRRTDGPTQRRSIVAAPAPSHVPASTYRLQLTKALGFEAAAKLVPYLDRLGITTCYASPVLAARPGSTHGYDTCDHSRISPELGGDVAFEAWADRLHDAGLGLIVDFVPNHMSIHPVANAWWRDVLENGPASEHA